MGGWRCHKVQTNGRNHPEVSVFAVTNLIRGCVEQGDVPAPSSDPQPLWAEHGSVILWFYACTRCQFTGDLQLHNRMEHKYKSWYYLCRQRQNYLTPYQFITHPLSNRCTWTRSFAREIAPCDALGVAVTRFSCRTPSPLSSSVWGSPL